ncbi:MAG: hypothetical protein HKP40_10195 [Litoreibacter sp.]|nr:hypothetical protein [Litoreibacter sp.]
MKVLFACTLVALLGLGTTGAVAKSLKDDAGPAELPPASFQGYQYVDSTGCAYIRTGYGGATTWVPRVQRNRQVTCGLTPSLRATARAAPQTENRVSGVQDSGQAVATAQAPRSDGLLTQRVPKGYQSAWSDGRLNEMRGVGTAQGDQQMLQIWTNTVPRRLVEGD